MVNARCVLVLVTAAPVTAGCGRISGLERGRRTRIRIVLLAAKSG